MSRGQIVTGLDIGTSTIKILVVEQRAQALDVLASASIPSFGLRRGVVVSIDETAKNIQRLVDKVQKDNNINISSVFVNINGSHLYVTPSDGVISVSRADQRISQEDVERVLQAARVINIPSNEEILDVFPKEFIIDDQKGIKQPEGLTGIRLEAKVILLCYFQSYFTNLTNAVWSAKLQTSDIVPSALAAAEAVLTPQQKELGVALIDIGSDTTSLAVFEEGDLMHLAVFPLGSANITKDIAIGLKTEFDTAEDIKKQYGTCMFSKIESSKKNQPKKKIEVVNNAAPLSFTEKDLAGIIEPRICEILDLMQKELKKIGRQELLPGGIVLTGGGAKLPKIKELVRQQLKLTCEIGVIRGIENIDQDPSLATVAGLVLGGAEVGDQGHGAAIGLGIAKNFFSKFKKMFRVFIP